MAKALPSYVRDSMDFIEKVKSIKCPPDAILSSWDVVSLYTNIPHKEGLEAVNKAAMRQPHCPVKPKVLTELAKIVLKNNTITFAGEYYLQLQGTAMGTRLAPAYANVFMGELEKIWHSHVDKQSIIAWYRFIDDIFLIWNGSEEELDEWVEKCNQTHSLIKITHEKSNLEATFLDVTMFKGPKFRMTGFLDYKTHVKPTNSRTYVHASSYHPEGTRKGVIVGEIHRFYRTNSSNLHFWNQVKEHIQALVKRGYNIPLVRKYIIQVLWKLKGQVVDQDKYLELENPISEGPTLKDISPEQMANSQRNITHSLDYIIPSTKTEPKANPKGLGVGRAVESDIITCKPPLPKADPKLPSNPEGKRQVIGKTPVLVMTYNDSLREINQRLKQLWKEDVDSQELLKKLFPTVPLIAISRNKSLSEYISKAIVPYEPRPYEGEQFKLREHIAINRDYPRVIGIANTSTT